MIKINSSYLSGLYMGICLVLPIIIYQYKKEKTSLNKQCENIKNDTGISTIEKINKIDKSPIELSRRFDNKGYVFMYRNLSMVNVELNEFIELMRTYELPQLDGCIDPDICECKYRHKRNRLLMIRKYSQINDLKFYSPSCKNVNNIMITDNDIKNKTELYKFIELYNNKFNNTVFDLVNYVKYIIDPNNEHRYIVDICLVAEPYYKGQKRVRTNGYGDPDSKNNDTYDVINKNNIYSLNWHQDQFIETKTHKPYAYDIIATFIINTNNITPHKLMIGKLNNKNIELNIMNIDDLQKYITTMDEIDIDNNSSDIGYIIDQRRNIFHKHSDFIFNDIESRRNVCTIKIKYIE